MIEVGIRELKARLSYYLQLVQVGETVAIKMRQKVIGFLSQLEPSTSKRFSKKKNNRRQFEKLKAKGLILSGRPYRPSSFKPVVLKGEGPSISQIVRDMRDER